MSSTSSSSSVRSSHSRFNLEVEDATKRLENLPRVKFFAGSKSAFKLPVIGFSDKGLKIYNIKTGTTGYIQYSRVIFLTYNGKKVYEPDDIYELLDKWSSAETLNRKEESSSVDGRANASRHDPLIMRLLDEISTLRATNDALTKELYQLKLVEKDKQISQLQDEISALRSEMDALCTIPPVPVAVALDDSSNSKSKKKGQKKNPKPSASELRATLNRQHKVQPVKSIPQVDGPGDSSEDLESRRDEEEEETVSSYIDRRCEEMEYEFKPEYGYNLPLTVSKSPQKWFVSVDDITENYGSQVSYQDMIYIVSTFGFKSYSLFMKHKIKDYNYDDLEALYETMSAESSWGYA